MTDNIKTLELDHDEVVIRYKEEVVDKDDNVGSYLYGLTLVEATFFGSNITNRLNVDCLPEDEFLEELYKQLSELMEEL